MHKTPFCPSSILFPHKNSALSAFVEHYDKYIYTCSTGHLQVANVFCCWEGNVKAFRPCSHSFQLLLRRGCAGFYELHNQHHTVTIHFACPKYAASIPFSIRFMVFHSCIIYQGILSFAASFTTILFVHTT